MAKNKIQKIQDRGNNGRRAKGTNTAWLYEKLRKAILSLSVRPGENLEEKELVEQFGISRTPVREALIRLASDGLVVLLPNRGARVAAVDLSDFPRYVEAYDLIQRAATRLAAVRRENDDIIKIKAAQDRFEKATAKQEPLQMTEFNRDYHAAIGDASHNPYLASQYKNLLDQGMRLLRIPFAYDPSSDDGLDKHLERIIVEHRTITQCIENKDAQNAERQAHDHTKLFQSRCLQYLTDIGTTDIEIAR